MARVTEKDLEEALTQMREATGLPLEIKYAYGSGKIVRSRRPDGSGGYLDFSPTGLSNAELTFWIYAFMYGWEIRGEVTK